MQGGRRSGRGERNNATITAATVRRCGSTGVVLELKNEIPIKIPAYLQFLML
jgi:hypothetical protein